MRYCDIIFLVTSFCQLDPICQTLTQLFYLIFLCRVGDHFGVSADWERRCSVQPPVPGESSAHQQLRPR